MMRKKGWLVLGSLALMGSLALGGVVLAQTSMPIPTAEPARTVSGTELKVGDPTAADSPVTLVSSSTQATLGATDLGAVTVRGQAAGEIRAVQEAMEASKVRLEYRQGEIHPLGAVPVNSTLNPNAAHLYGPYWYNAGDTVTLSSTWVPTASVFRIGLTSQASRIFYGCQVAGGAGTCQLTVNQAGWYYPTIWNVGPYTATYSGFVSW
ncbi:hypothetical protein [Thermoflexus sp.]|uniref:hypothetical protein n=2 Tax=Thermoflexus sp. TaxID=1969742 RepID=UPI0025F3CB8F|nr:hypothetical protein [Thermoflexus sp.]MCS6964904.1 hypothetical protein [Thermoflexus sp.]MCX7689253.1 hypothetical protein [Thermoflexus sp.]MDW8183789.1 hypothetical protein [Anaerolineae bacterium]